MTTLRTLLLIILLMLNLPAHAKEMKVGVQLWSVKNTLKKDFRGTIKQLANMGFDGVELAGEYGEFANDPKGLAKFINSQGMEILGTHTNFDLLSDAKFEQTMQFYKDAGAPTAVIAWDDRAFDPATVWKTIADLNRILPKVEAYGIRFGYHNHGQEFGDYRDVTLWDHIARSTPDSLVMQLDVGWASAVNKNPTEFVRRHPGRTLSTHFKAAENEEERGKLPIIGKDSIDWLGLIKANQSVGGTQWLIVEQEVYPNGMSEMEAVAASKQGLDGLLKQGK